MSDTIQLGDIPVDVKRKDIKNIHLSVHPPCGRVTISAPHSMKLETIRVYAVSKLDWIKKQQLKLRAQEREPAREFLYRESHYVWGKRYLLSIHEADVRPYVDLSHDHMVIMVPDKADGKRCELVLEKWYRDQIYSAAPALISKWESVMGVSLEKFYVRRMKTMWGSCNHGQRTIRLNTELAKKPVECLEYILVHELSHLIEPTHNERFQALMNRFLPNWRSMRAKLNSLPVRHEDWAY